MFFGATSFASTPFAGVGITNVTVNAVGNRINVAIGNTAINIVTTVPVTGQRFKLANNTIDVITWNQIIPGATGIWIPIDPDNP